MVTQILAENNRRRDIINAPFNPITGLGSVGERTCVQIDDFPLKTQFLPNEMMHIPLVKKLVEHASVAAFIKEELKEEPTTDNMRAVWRQFVRIRCKHDFPFWAAMFIIIKYKGGSEGYFNLTLPQRKFVQMMEDMRKAGKPIRIILLKARQWGGSTTSQLYMMWLQLMHKKGLNSLIVAHQGSGSDEIKDMFDRALQHYPAELLHDLGEQYDNDEKKVEGVGKSGSIQRVIARDCKIKIGTAERPDGCRGGDYSLVHLSEVGLWRATEGKKPEDIVRSACSGVLLKPYTMIVYESTANGAGNFFHREYVDAKDGKSQFTPLFISWFEIELYTLPFASDEERNKFAQSLYENRLCENAPSVREESGSYIWYLWNCGATLEAIHWYTEERRKYNDHGKMASEYPSDDMEAFVNSGNRVFDMYQLNDMRRCCKPPKYIGEVVANGDTGKEAMLNTHFVKDAQGLLAVWQLPEQEDEDTIVTNRYLVVVDIGGRWQKADYSVIAVFDRIYMTDDEGKPVIVAQWRGHIDMDKLAWKATQIACFYHNAKLVIESNTLETHDQARQVDGDQSLYILNLIADVYPNLYARSNNAEDKIKDGMETTYGFHTNTKTKPIIISTLINAIRDKLYIERDENAIDEMANYERKQNGAFGAIDGCHDDILMTRAIGLYICFHKMPLPKVVDIKKQRKARAERRKRTVSAATI